MSTPAYVDRRSGRRRQDAIYRHGLLDWMYNSRPGWFLTRFVLSRGFVSRVYGWINRRPSSARKIPAFVRAMGVDMEESLRPIDSFANFNKFITREIDLSRRPLDPDPRVCVAPADGRLLAYPVIDDGTRLAPKQSSFSLQAFLRDERMASRYMGGSMIITRLYLADYHHFHFPADGVAREPVKITGRCYATTPYSRRWVVPFLAENHRQITTLDSDHFGSVALVEVGAFTIGSIRQCFAPGGRVHRGERKGWFELGGSAIVMLFEAGAIRLDADLCAHTESGTETYVRLGESIGRAGGERESSR